MTSRSSSESTNFATEVISITDAQPVEEAADSAALPFSTVAIGASAGGVEALIHFFKKMPTDSGCAFIVVMHLAAERESMLVPLLGRATTMPVQQVAADSDLAPNRIYVGPPGQYVEVRTGRLCLSPIAIRPPRPSTVDHLMISLASDQRERAIGIVMSGVDSDGAMGIKAIKSEGGLTIAQLESEAAHPGMPRSAMATGRVDRELPIDAMANVIVDFVRVTSGERPEFSPVAKQDSVRESESEELLMQEILSEVRGSLGLDFQGYKAPMLLRRIQRRMGLARISRQAEYLAYLKQAPLETRALADDFLISVTEFFREPEAWKALAQDVLPTLFSDRPLGGAVRAWVPACATGEEAYSLAMVLLDDAQVNERRLRLQVFATDIDVGALEVGRRGIYPQTIAPAVGAERLQRFFQPVEGGYQVSKLLRESVVFAPQNVVNDPPFSRMDVISCRNLLIYMEPVLQRRVLQSFHFGLEQDAVLALGKAETIGSESELFTSATPRARIYRRVGAGRIAPAVLLHRSSWHAGSVTPRVPAAPERDYPSIMRQALLEHRIGAAVVINRDGTALYFYGPVHAFLEQPEGLPTNDLFAMLHIDLRPQVRAAIHEAAATGQRAETMASMDLSGEATQLVRIVVSALPEQGQVPLLLVTFERPESASDAGRVISASEGAALHALEGELRNTKRELRGAIEELQSMNEELKIANEEAMSTNEELQSTNEELETSKEELQSINEELTSVNDQLSGKLGELEEANNDLGNLLSSTHIATLFLDRDFHVKRFTPATTKLFPLRATDIDRPLSDIASQSDVESLLADAREVLEHLAPIETETAGANGECFLRRTLPYRTQSDRIEGVVVTFTDITALKRAGDDLRQFAAVMQGSSDAIVVYDLQGKVLVWNMAAQTLYGASEGAMEQAEILTFLPEAERRLHHEKVQRLLGGEVLQGVESRRVRMDGTIFDVSATSSLVCNDAGRPVAVAAIERDITPQKKVQAELRESEHRFRSLANSAPVLIWMADANGALTFANNEFSQFTGLEGATLNGRRWLDLLHRDDCEAVADGVSDLRKQGTAARFGATARLQTATGGYRWMMVSVLPRAFQPEGFGVVGAMVDIDVQVTAERELREAAQHKDEFIAMLGHELRNPLVPIRNAAEVLNQVAGDNPRLGWIRDVLVRQVDHVTRLVDDLLDLSLITRSKMRLHLEPVDLGHVTDLAIAAVAPLIEQKQHRFRQTIPQGHIWVEGDAIRLAQIVENLLTNAAKYTDSGGEVSIEVGVDSDQAVVVVKDNGLGIAPEVSGRIFDLFVQDERSLDRSQGGLGIGLALVRHLTALHHGSVEAQSEGVGRGSTFTLRLPLLPQVPVPTSSDLGRAPARGEGRVLVVDDDVDGALSLVMLLEMYGYAVAFAADLESALKKAKELRPEVVLLDIGMPVADGYEVAKRLRALPEMDPNSVYMAISGFGQPENVRRSAEAGFKRHLVKPVEPNTLHKLLRESLEEMRPAAC